MDDASSPARTSTARLRSRSTWVAALVVALCIVAGVVFWRAGIREPVSVRRATATALPCLDYAQVDPQGGSAPMAFIADRPGQREWVREPGTLTEWNDGRATFRSDGGVESEIRSTSIICDFGG